MHRAFWICLAFSFASGCAAEVAQPVTGDTSDGGVDAPDGTAERDALAEIVGESELDQRAVDAKLDGDGGTMEPGDCDAAGGVVAYDAPGCGPNTPAPRCFLRGDACLGPLYCGCDGHTFYGLCGPAQAPFASVGACPDASDASDMLIDCGTVKCSGSEICLRERGGLDSSPTTFRCIAEPAGCGGNPSCSCLEIFPSCFGGGGRCQMIGPRAFACNQP